MHFRLLIFHLPLDIFKYNRHQRSVAALQPALQARNPTHCFECFPDALKFGPIQLHRRIGAVTLPTQDTFFYCASCDRIPVQAVKVSGPFSALPGIRIHERFNHS